MYTTIIVFTLATVLAWAQIRTLNLRSAHGAPAGQVAGPYLLWWGGLDLVGLALSAGRFTGLPGSVLSYGGGYFFGVVLLWAVWSACRQL